MDVLIVLVFVSIVLVAGSIVLFLFTMNQRDFEHGERLALLPLTETTRERGDVSEVDTSVPGAETARGSAPSGLPDSQGSSPS